MPAFAVFKALSTLMEEADRLAEVASTAPIATSTLLEETER
jgi:hypothetical protein